MSASDKLYSTLQALRWWCSYLITRLRNRGPHVTLVTLASRMCTVEPLNNGHVGTSDIVHYSEVSFTGRLAKDDALRL